MKTESQKKPGIMYPNCQIRGMAVVRSANIAFPSVMFAERTTTINHSYLLNRKVFPTLILAVTGLLLIQACPVECQEATGQKQSPFDDLSEPTITAWGTILPNLHLNTIMLTIDETAESIALPTPMANITRATFGSREWPGEPLGFSFNSDASEISLHLPGSISDQPVGAVLETAESSQQFPDGRIVLSALDATVVGAVAKLETQPGNHRIGYWSNADDFVRWHYKATRPGKYRLHLTWSVAGEPGSEASDIGIEIGQTRLAWTLTATGSWYEYRTVEIGDVWLPEPADYTVCVRCIAKKGGAVMNLKALTLIPACEGTPPRQQADGTILLHASDSTINGTLLQWEPNEEKRTIGYWADVNDSAYWDFTVTRAGKFDVEILQGCGKGQGGSTTGFAIYSVGNHQPAVIIPHTVVDTGHWQAFKPFEIGQVGLEAGKYRLRVTANSKTADAVMDLRQVLLSPAK